MSEHVAKLKKKRSRLTELLIVICLYPVTTCKSVSGLWPQNVHMVIYLALVFMHIVRDFANGATVSQNVHKCVNLSSIFADIMYCYSGHVDRCRYSEMCIRDRNMRAV